MSTESDIIDKMSSDINVVTVILASSAAVLSSSTLLFILGCVCGYYLSQKCKKVTNGEDVPNQPAVPIYENQILQLRDTRSDENEPELSHNMAYGYICPQNATDT